jgi:hypothetical protein
LPDINANLPLGTSITVVDSGNAGRNNIVIEPGDSTINGLTPEITIAGNFGGVTLVSDGISNWTALRLSFNGIDEVDNGEEISLSTAVSYFATEAEETSTLPAGIEGQVKTLIMSVYVGTMTVNVPNAGWIVGSGTGDIIFDQKGDACTLQFINNAWFMVSNNGCEFGNIIPVVAGSVPITASSSGRAGTIAYDAAFMYICVASNTWKRVAITSW